MGDSVVKYSLASLVGLLTLAVYLVLVPLMVFLVKIKSRCALNAVRRVLPRNRGLAGRVWNEDESARCQLYPREKCWRWWWWAWRLAGLCCLASSYSLLLAVLVRAFGPDHYISAFVVTIPVVGVALFQFGTGTEFLELFCRLSDYSGAGWQSAGTGTFLRSGEFASAGDYSVSGDFSAWRSVGFLGCFRHSIGDAD